MESIEKIDPVLELMRTQLKDEVMNLSRFVNQLDNPIGSRNFTDEEIDSGRNVVEIIQDDILKALEKIEEISKEIQKLKS